MNEILIVNENEDTFYEHCYNVYLWAGVGYQLQGFRVFANYDEQALEIVVAYCEKKGMYGFLINCKDLEESDDYIYIDATMEGATQPYFIYDELKIEEIK